LHQRAETKIDVHEFSIAVHHRCTTIERIEKRRDSRQHVFAIPFMSIAYEYRRISMDLLSNFCVGDFAPSTPAAHRSLRVIREDLSGPCEELLCKGEARGRTTAQAVINGWVVGMLFYAEFNDNRAKRGVVMIGFLGAAIWLSWCGERYDDRHNSALPAVMCAVESIVLVITGAALSCEAPTRASRNNLCRTI
jgi:hypothetical protein